MILDFDVIVTRIRTAQAAATRPILVAIDGRSGSGKSTLARAIAQHLPCRVVEGDDFYAGGTKLRSEDAQTLAATCIHWRAQIPVLTALLAGQPATYMPFDWHAFDGSHGAPKTIMPAKILVLEGVYSARPELCDLLDLSILLTLPEPERLRRPTAREGAISAWEAQWHRAEDWYFGNTPHKFDMTHTACTSTP